MNTREILSQLTQKLMTKQLQPLQVDKGELRAAGTNFKFLCVKRFKLEQTGSRTVLHCKKS